MIVYVGTQSAHRFGGHPCFSLVGGYLTSGLAGCDSAIDQIEVTACFRGGPVPHPSRQSSHDDFHSTFLPSLPRIRFLRKRRRVTIQYETAVADATFLSRYGFLSAEIFGKALREVGQNLHLMDDRVKRDDNFELPKFHSSVARLIAEAPTSDESLRVLKVRLEREDQERLAAMDPWELLDLDWDEFHPNARVILDDPFYWSTSDDYSPNGNDTGADLLNDFEKWNRRYGDVPAYRMATSLLKKWDIAGFDYDTLDESALRALLGNDPIAVSVTDDALIAVAFAAIKFRGCCDEKTRQITLKAIKRERMPAVLAGRGWQDAAERLRTLELISNALVTAPTSAS
jgi:uncharacterized protein YfeS